MSDQPVIVTIEKLGTFAPVLEWGVKLPVSEELLDDPLAFGTYVLRLVAEARRQV